LISVTLQLFGGPIQTWPITWNLRNIGWGQSSHSFLRRTLLSLNECLLST
jgi:hypothetical protein